MRVIWVAALSSVCHYPGAPGNWLISHPMPIRGGIYRATGHPSDSTRHRASGKPPATGQPRCGERIGKTLAPSRAELGSCIGLPDGKLTARRASFDELVPVRGNNLPSSSSAKTKLYMTSHNASIPERSRLKIVARFGLILKLLAQRYLKYSSKSIFTQTFLVILVKQI